MSPDAILETLRIQRAKTGLTRIEVAKKVGVHDRTIKAWEQGLNDLPLRKALKLCTIYGITISELVADEKDIEGRMNQLEKQVRQLKTIFLVRGADAAS